MADTQELDSELLEAYMKKFYGYGNFSAPYWFIGKEEACNGTAEDINNRINKWQERGCKTLEDVRDYSIALGITNHFTTPKIDPQRTWQGIIKVVQAANGRKLVAEGMSEEEKQKRKADLKIYQQYKLARLENSETCLMELLPLPSPSSGTHNYSSFRGLEKLGYLKSKKVYREEVSVYRKNFIKEAIARYQPPVVVFYGQDSWFKDKWEYIAGIELKEELTANSTSAENSIHRRKISGIKTALIGKTRFYLIRHFADALYDTDLEKLGNHIREHLIKLNATDKVE